jgi:hypothetical protein
MQLKIVKYNNESPGRSNARGFLTKTDIKGISMAENNLTQTRVQELLHYDPETGVFTWKVNRRGTARAGSVAGRLHLTGYREIRIDRQRHKAHRLAWLYVHGEWPDGQVDHINGVRHDNRISNLRVVPNQSEQQKNQKKPSNNTSGVTGVYWGKKSRKYYAQIKYQGANKHLGYFDDFEEACMIRWLWEYMLGFHENHGKTAEERAGSCEFSEKL